MINIIQVRRSAKLKCDRFVGTGMMKHKRQICKLTSAGSSENTDNSDTRKVMGEKQKWGRSYAVKPSYLSGQEAKNQIRCIPLYNLSQLPRCQDTLSKKSAPDSNSPEFSRKDQVAQKVECSLTIDVNSTVRISNKKFPNRCSYITLENNAKFKIPIMIDVDIHKEENERPSNMKSTKPVTRDGLAMSKVRSLPRIESRALLLL